MKWWGWVKVAWGGGEGGALPEASQTRAGGGVHIPQIVGSPVWHNGHTQTQANCHAEDEAAAPCQGVH